MSEEIDEFQSYRDKVGTGRGNFNYQYEKLIRTWRKVHADSIKEINEGRDSSVWRREFAEQHKIMADKLEMFGNDKYSLSLYIDSLITCYCETFDDEAGILDAVGFAVVELENLLNAE